MAGLENSRKLPAPKVGGGGQTPTGSVRHLLWQCLPIPCPLITLGSQHPRLALQGTACPVLPHPESCSHSSLLPAPKGRVFCAVYLIESIHSSGKCFNPSPLFPPLKIGETEAQRSQEMLPDTTAKRGKEPKCPLTGEWISKTWIYTQWDVVQP